MAKQRLNGRFSLARAWFPLAGLILILLALPGMILLTLHLLGEAGPVNEWLEENFQLTSQLAVPEWLAFVLLLVIPAIIILYFLKLKRKPLQVPSTFLWKKSIEDLHVNSLFQWLRENILLLLQLLAVLVMIYGVLGFRFHGNTSRGRHYILIIDNSASMAATDVAPSRLHWAKQEALKEIDASGDDDFGMVIVFNSKATTLQGYTSNRAQLRDAVQSIEQTQRPTRIEEALNLADSLANPVRSTEDVSVQPEDVPAGQERMYVPPKGITTTVHLYSDGRYAPISEAALASLNSRASGNTSVLGNLNLRYHMAGNPGPENADNVGIVVFNAVRWGDPANNNQDLQKLQVLLRVRNFRPQKTSVHVRLDVYVQEKIVHVDQRRLLLRERQFVKGEEDLDARDKPGEADVTFVLPALDLRRNTYLRAYFDNPKDSFPTDDSAWLVVGMVRKAKVLIVGDSNPILDAFFEQEATRRVARVDRLTPADLKTEAYQKVARSGDVDLVIFDRVTPEEEKDLPLANTFFIGQAPPPWERGKQQLKNPYLVVSKREHPLLRHLTTLWDVGVTEAFKFDLKENLQEKAREPFNLPETDTNRRVLPPMTRLIETGGQTPVLFTLPRGPFTELVMAFPILNERGDLTTNWPLQPSFPLFLRNTLYTLGNIRDAVREESVQPGEPMILRPEAGVKWVEVTPPKGNSDKIERGGRPHFSYGDTDHLGVYQVAQDDGASRSFAVNLLDSNESNIEPLPEIKIGEERVTTDEERKQPREIWKWIILAALIVLMVEWYVYNRRVYI
jgi:hypothetical protein